MKKISAFILAVIIFVFSLLTVYAESGDVLAPDKQIAQNFREFYAEQTGGESPQYVYCYKLDDFPTNADDDYDYYTVNFASDKNTNPWYYIYLGVNNEFYLSVSDVNKLYKSGHCIFKGYVYDDEYKYSFYSLEEIEKENPEAIEYLEDIYGVDSIGVINGDMCYYPLVAELDTLCWDVVHTFGICSGDYYHNPGYSFLYINEKSEIQVAMDEAVDIIERTGFNYINGFDSNGITKQEVVDAYEKLEAAIRNATVTKYEVEFLVEHFGTEGNKNGYYPDELYNAYTESVENAKAFLAKENPTNDECNKVYWDLLYNYNRLCSVNTLINDVDFNGSVDVMDATEYQRVLAGIVQNNSSIRYVTNFDSLAATKIQRRLAGYDLNKPLYGQNELNNIAAKQEILNIESEEFDFSAWKINELYYSHRIAGRC